MAHFASFMTMKEQKRFLNQYVLLNQLLESLKDSIDTIDNISEEIGGIDESTMKRSRSPVDTIDNISDEIDRIDKSAMKRSRSPGWSEIADIGIDLKSGPISSIENKLSTIKHTLWINGCTIKNIYNENHKYLGTTLSDKHRIITQNVLDPPELIGKEPSEIIFVNDERTFLTGLQGLLKKIQDKVILLNNDIYNLLNETTHFIEYRISQINNSIGIEEDESSDQDSSDQDEFLVLDDINVDNIDRPPNKYRNGVAPPIRVVPKESIGIETDVGLHDNKLYIDDDDDDNLHIKRKNEDESDSDIENLRIKRKKGGSKRKLRKSKRKLRKSKRKLCKTKRKHRKTKRTN